MGGLSRSPSATPMSSAVRWRQARNPARSVAEKVSSCGVPERCIWGRVQGAAGSPNLTFWGRGRTPQILASSRRHEEMESLENLKNLITTLPFSDLSDFPDSSDFSFPRAGEMTLVDLAHGPDFA